MHELGAKIGAQLKPGDLILLNGALGAGKTVLVQGIARALGIEGVTSPTFVISKVYRAPLSLIHVDVYRLLDSNKAAMFLDDLDLDSDRDSAVTVIEWGGAESARLSDERLEITIEIDQEVRSVAIHRVGARWDSFSL
ncbi:MAG: tRNA (adenosine(37)-N6)-threonylcarbamoyltransferase complex ATPase subunit type 1 TsaE [Actinobacteria bacterium]|nr:tRNA (adenosine(37)-N6)-threonylcarbamoyltransferase complex ATPase subunit type 1 TsaE [Actinomycetota bacterium]MSX69999.1 tRNA (adenosine(37)-N6)-threonylcarbamoyltransferase complex ATPase subunit type 1 TsaE [Actinomycetota bacterium]MSY93203.1 tRNA (adenosine(37)-N6)-threonylcarbamoyltransferase complex ATPase subunit type 1 TsaE [Actinomycetota bacterium]